MEAAAPRGEEMMGLIDSYHRRQLKAVRRELKRLTRVVNRTFRPNPPDDMRESLELLWTDLVKFERDVGKGDADVVFHTKMLRTWAIVLRREAMDFNRLIQSRRFSWEHSPLESVFERLDRLDITIYSLYGPPTKFQRMLTKLVQKSALSVYRLAQLAEVDESYLRRLVTGEKRNPRENIVISLAMALREGSSSVSVRDIHRLIKSAGYRPPSREELDDYRAANSA